MGGFVLPVGQRLESYISSPFSFPLGNTAGLLFLSRQVASCPDGWPYLLPRVATCSSPPCMTEPTIVCDQDNLRSCLLRRQSIPQLRFLNVEQSPLSFHYQMDSVREKYFSSSHVQGLSCKIASVLLTPAVLQQAGHSIALPFILVFYRASSSAMRDEGLLGFPGMQTDGLLDSQECVRAFQSPFPSPDFLTF